MIERVICLVIGYFLGIFQTGFIYGKIKHIDIRQHGSGNAGTTNALRTLGWKAGFITFFGDLLKAIIAGIIVTLIYKCDHQHDLTVLRLYAGIGVVLGHNFPFYLKFKGGKGIAATAGVICSLGNWQLIVFGFCVFMLTLYITHYVSSSSLVLLTTLFGGFVVLSNLKMIHYLDCGKPQYEAIILMLIFVILGFIRHKANIARLLNGTENELKLKKHMGEENL